MCLLHNWKALKKLMLDPSEDVLNDNAFDFSSKWLIVEAFGIND
jgi:hypothetical protein